MKMIYLYNQSERPLPCVATIGFFDGVHLGHRYIINKVVETAQREHLASAVITFARHPRQVLQSDWHPQLLSTFDEKVVLLSQTGVNLLVVLPFDVSMAALSAYRFMHDVLLRQLNVRILVTGYDNHFGHSEAGSSEGFNDYVKYGRTMGMAVIQGDPFDAADIRVSSSKIRRFLSAGEVEQAASCLGRPYQLLGKVVSGHHVGTVLGFPTANLQPQDADKLVPAVGVYAVKVRLENSLEMKHGMMNIGRRPTFNGEHLTLETHIFRFEDNLYGRQMSVWFVGRLRSEMRFESREALIAQLELDARRAEEILNQTIEI